MDSLIVDIHRDESASSDSDEPEPGNPCDLTPNDEALTKWAKLGYQNAVAAEVSLAILGKDAMTALNKEYRNKDKPTNVLSFPVNEPVSPDSDVKLLGDILFCPSVIAQEASEQKKELAHHWAHMCIHGMLHLQGYDHVNEDDANTMEALEIKLLASANIPNPYLT